MKVVILAGGFGTRLSEYTRTIPKPMISICGKPIITYIIKHYEKFGFREFIIATGYKHNYIKNSDPLLYYLDVLPVSLVVLYLKTNTLNDLSQSKLNCIHNYF